VARVKDWNGLRSNTVRVGQRLTIWQEAPQARSKKTAAKKKNATSAQKARSGPQKVSTPASKQPAQKTTGG
jgi:membrane-bound lytic murein transglycosylase D